METIFKDHALKYLSMGYSVIPINRNSKTPTNFMVGWSKYSKVLPTENEVESWANRAPASNIAIVCGEASKIVCIDIDDDKLLASPHIPRSPLTRRGKKGEARFFQWAPWMTSFSIAGKIDFQANGKYIVVAPSIHPDTGDPYVWNGEFKTLVPYDSLPELTEEQGNEMKRELSIQKAENDTGRNNKLKTMAVAAFHNGKIRDEIIDELLEYDLANHTPPLFLDNKEMYFRRMKTERGAASLFVDSILKSVNGSIVTAGLPSIEIKSKIDNSIDRLVVPVPKTEILKMLHSTCLSNSEAYNEAIALGTSLTAMSMLVANRFILDVGRSKKSSGNLYTLILGSTGIGKDAAIDTIQSLLMDFDFVTGFEKSGSSLAVDLGNHRERLYVIDEISQLFANMKSGKNTSYMELCELLCQVFSSNQKIMLLPKTIASRKDKTADQVLNPYVSILGTTTGSGLANSVNRLIVEKGLLPRFLFFKQTWAPLWETRPTDYSLEIKTFFRNFLSDNPIEFIDGPITKQRMVKHRIINLTPEAKKYYDIMFKDAHYEKEHLDTSKSESDDFLVRKIELVNKVALLDAISDGVFEVDIKHLQYGEEVFNFSICCIKEYVPLIFGSDYGKMRQDILNYIKHKGKCRLNELSNRFRNLTQQDKNKILMDLKISGSVVETMEKSDNGKGPNVTYFTFVEDIRP